MGTSFHCEVTVSTHPKSGKVAITIGWMDMAHLAEMLAYFGTEEFSDCVFDAASQAFLSNPKDMP